MGWYHVNNTGKGINLGDGEEVHYNEDFLARYVPTKEEVLALVPSFKNEDLEGYEAWPLCMKFVAAAGDWYNLHLKMTSLFLKRWTLSRLFTAKARPMSVSQCCVPTTLPAKARRFVWTARKRTNVLSLRSRARPRKSISRPLWWAII